MNTFRKPLIAVALVLAVLAAILGGLDIFFRNYEKKTFIKEVDVNAQVYDLKALSFNDQGPPLPREEEPGEFRILSIGDSYAAAITKPQYTYSAVLEGDLNRLSAGRRVRVVNLGVGGISFPEYMAQYRFWSRLLRFDAVLFNVYCGNDFTDVEDKPFDPALTRMDRFVTGMGATLPHKFPLRFLDYAYGIYRAQSNLVPADDFYNPSYQVPWDQYLHSMAKSARIYNPAELPRLANGLDWAGRFLAFVKEIEDSGVKAAVLVSPPHLLFDAKLKAETTKIMGITPETLDPAQPVFLLDELRKRAGVPEALLDPRECLASHAGTQQALYYGTDTHWTVAGNQVVGDYLAGVLAERWLGVTPNPAFSDCPVSPVAAPSQAAKDAVLGQIQ
jgi:hypothetical protein